LKILDWEEKLRRSEIKKETRRNKESRNKEEKKEIRKIR
jgi:hypothetical protein